MNCSRFRNSLSAFIERELSQVELEAFQAHVVDCPACHDLSSNTELAIQELKLAEKVTVSPQFALRLQERLEGQTTSPALRWKDWWSFGQVFGLEPRYATASVLAAFALIFFLFQLLPMGSAPEGRSPYLAPVDSPHTPLPTVELLPGGMEFAEAEEEEGADSSTAADSAKRPRPGFDDRIRLVKDRK